MSSIPVVTSMLYLLLIAFMASLPQAALVQPRSITRLALGALCGAASLAIIASEVHGGLANVAPVRPSLLASAALLWGPRAGFAAAATAIGGLWLTPHPDWSAALYYGSSSVAAGMLWWGLQRHARLPEWGAAAGLALSLPLVLLPWLNHTPDAPAAQQYEAHARHVLGVVVLCGGSALLRTRAYTLLTLRRREGDLRRALRATGGGRWEWDLREGRLLYAGRLYRQLGLRDSPDDSATTLASLPLGSRAWRRWIRERHHPEDLRRLRPYLRRALAGREPSVQVEFRIRDDLGRWRWLMTRGHATQRDATGRVLRLAGMDLDVTEQREMREALRDSEVRYSSFYQALPDAAGIIRVRDGRYLDVNPAFERMLGTAGAQVVGRTSLELGLRAVDPGRERLLGVLHEQGAVRGLPVTVASRGEAIAGLLSLQPIELRGERCMVFVFHDVTQERRMRDELLATNSLLRQAGWMARLGVWESKPGAGIVYWSDVCHDIHGLAPGAPLPAEYLETFVAPEWREPAREQLSRSLRERKPWHAELQIIRADGVRLWVRVRTEPVVEGGRAVGARGILQDIDEMRRASERLRASEQRLAQMFQLLPSPLGFSRRADGVYVDVNPAWERVTGHSREKSIGQSSISLGILAPEARAGLMQAVERGETVGYEMDITTASGERRTVLHSLSPADLHDEECWLFALLDITERKRAEQQVREREELLSLTIAAASLGLWDWDIVTGSISGDARWRAMLGLESQAQHPAPWPQAWAQADPQVIGAELERHLREPAQPFDVTVQTGAPGAAERWVRSMGKIVAWAGDGQPRRMLGMSIDVTSQRAQARQLERMAHYDALTGLPNRVLLEQRMRQAMERARGCGDKLGVAYLDLDGFKPVNDRLGHAAGDRLLVQVAGRLQSALRPGDCVARLGGDEFVILLPGLASGGECEARMNALMQSVSAPYQLDSERMVVTASIGYTLFPDNSADADTLLRHADQAMYAAKQAGRNRYQQFDAAHERAQQALLEARQRLRQALEAGELALHLQPKVDMRRGAVVGAEALARWRHPERGVLAPAHFLPLLDGDTLLQALFGEWVVDSALHLVTRLMQEGLALPISINITPEHLQRSDFAGWMASRLALHPQVPAQLLHLELTESAALYDIEHAARELGALRALGLGLAFDDFGTGYSSLSYLRRLPMDYLKLDRSFVAGMLHDTGDRAIVHGVIGLGRSFGCETIAEGVETLEQGRALLDMGCTLAQGHCIARPLPPDDFIAWARTWRAPAAWCESGELQPVI